MRRRALVALAPRANSGNGNGVLVRGPLHGDLVVANVQMECIKCALSVDCRVCGSVEHAVELCTAKTKGVGPHTAANTLI